MLSESVESVAVPTAAAVAIALGLVETVKLSLGALSSRIKHAPAVTAAANPPSARCPGLPELDRTRLAELCDAAREQSRSLDRIGLQLERLAAAQEEANKALREIVS